MKNSYIFAKEITTKNTNKMKQNLKDIGLAFILWGLFITAVSILTL